MATVDRSLLRQALIDGGIQHSSLDDLFVHTLPSTGGGAFNTTVHQVSSATDSWTVVIKQVSATDGRWGREVEAYDDAWLRSSLPDALRMPQLLASERSPETITLVLEHLPSDRPASGADLANAAELLTCFSAAHRQADRPWWSTGRLITEFEQLANHPERLVRPRTDPALEELRAQLQTLIEQAPKLLEILTALPLGPAHLDAFSRNLLVDRDGCIGLVDWAEAGRAPLGTDPATLLVWTLDYLDADHRQIAELEVAITDGMVAGLTGPGHEALVTHALTAFGAVARLRHLAMMMNALPMVEAGNPAVSAIVGRPLDQIVEQWIAVGDHLLGST